MFLLFLAGLAFHPPISDDDTPLPALPPQGRLSEQLYRKFPTAKTVLAAKSDTALQRQPLVSTVPIPERVLVDRLCEKISFATQQECLRGRREIECLLQRQLSTFKLWLFFIMFLLICNITLCLFLIFRCR